VRLLVAWLATAVIAGFSGAPARAQLNDSAQRAYEKFQTLPPHRAFVVAADGRVFYRSRAAGADPNLAIEHALNDCAERKGTGCRLYAVNNVVLDGRTWQQAAPPLLPQIGRLRPEPYWQNQGPRVAGGLVVWSHGYKSGTDSSTNAPQGEVVNFLRQGYDLYRFDRVTITDWHRDTADFVEALRTARTTGYRRIILAGQSAGAWVSLAALGRGAPVDGVISISAAHHGQVKDMRNPDLARSEWLKLMEAIKPGPRLALVQFAGDAFDVGGRMNIAYDVLTQSRVEAIIIDHPPGFEGHGAGTNPAFPLKFGACIDLFIQTGSRQPPCI
jgi:pimeloyl-ACP methyl ester carboxylesterase